MPTTAEDSLTTIPHLITVRGLTHHDLDSLLEAARRMERVLEASHGHSTMLGGKIVAMLFYEPSTRTRFSFEAATLRLGGQVIGTDDARKVSSVSKGETLEDTIRIVSGYADCIVLRHDKIGAAKRAAEVSRVPIVNAGDGAGEHPTQALLDLFTIQKERGRIEGLTVTMCGDLKYGRTVHSLCRLLALYGVKMHFVSPRGLALPPDVLADLQNLGTHFDQSSDLGLALSDSDVIYVTRIQKERFQSRLTYWFASRQFMVDMKTIEDAKTGLTVMHPLPRLNELSTSVDGYAGAAYFRQAENGVPVRMAILSRLLTAH